jgi:hypothetical protein
MAEAQTLDEAVNSAAANLAAGGENNTGEEGTGEDNKGGEGSGAAEVSKDAAKLIHGLTEEELPNAAQIFQALKDPEKAKVFVKFLAENNGYVLPAKNDDDATGSKGEPTMVDLLKEHLGDEFEPFAEKLAPALEKIMAKQIEKATKPFNERLQNQDQDNQKKEITGILETFAKDNFADGKLPDPVVAEMGKLMKQFTPSKDVDNKTYIGSLLKMSMTNLNIVPKTSKSARNFSDPLAHLSNNATAKPKDGKAVAPKNMSIEEAVLAAAQQLDSKTN